MRGFYPQVQLRGNRHAHFLPPSSPAQFGSYSSASAIGTVGAFSVQSGSDWADQVVSNEITWRFDAGGPGPGGTYRVGQFITGDWWVVGPVTVNSVYPAPSGSGSSYRNGSMVNPGSEGTNIFRYNGYDGRSGWYSSGLSITYPKDLVAGDSLISTISGTDGSYTDAFGMGCSVPGQALLKGAEILTCLASTPSTDAFRPPYVGTTKTIYTESQINWSLLPNLTTVSGFKTQVTYERWVARPWIDCGHPNATSGGNNYTIINIRPYENMTWYGRDLMGAIGELALWLCTNNTQAVKRKSTIGLIQAGIDYYYASLIRDDMWNINGGGHMGGKKFPIQFAGLMLGQTAIQNKTYLSVEDNGTYFGTDVSPNHTLWTGWQNSAHKYAANVLFRFDSLGDDIWCHEFTDVDNWGSSPWPYWNRSPFDIYGHEGYNRLNKFGMIGEALAARILGMKTAWNHNAFFAMADRWMYESDTPIRQTIYDHWWGTSQPEPPPYDEAHHPDGSLRYVGDPYNDCQGSLDQGGIAWGGGSGPTNLMWAAYRESYDG